MSNGNYFHFHKCDNGVDYTLYNNDGILLDGGVMEYTSSNPPTIIEVLKMLSEFTGIKELLEDVEYVDESIIESFDSNFKI